MCSEPRPVSNRIMSSLKCAIAELAWAAATTLLWFGVASAADLTKSKYQGWETYHLSNGIVSLEVAPQLGGRLIQYSLGVHHFLWANPALAGQIPPASGLGPGGTFLNWGGDKLWPAPQGWDGPEQWPGPPDAVLDGSPYRADTLHGPALRLTSQKDARSGIQFSRVVTLENGTSILHVHATIEDIDTKPRSWGIWTVTQLDARNASGNGFNPNFWGYIPANPRSHFSHSFKILFGDKTNPEFQYDPQQRMMRVHYQRKMGKIAMDSPSGWVANVDGNSGYIFVQTFRYEADHEYPDGASVEYWTNGLGKIFACGKETIQPESSAVNPYAIESELLSPRENLQPGQSASFDYEWRVARIGGGFPVLDCTAAGCTAESLASKRTRNGTLTFSGRFGLFYEGAVRARILDAGRNLLLETATVKISPNSPLVMQTDFPKVSAPANARVLELVVFDTKGKAIDKLARCTITDE
jgi:hypothetical protein